MKILVYHMTLFQLEVLPSHLNNIVSILLQEICCLPHCPHAPRMRFKDTILRVDPYLQLP